MSVSASITPDDAKTVIETIVTVLAAYLVGYLLAAGALFWATRKGLLTF